MTAVFNFHPSSLLRAIDSVQLEIKPLQKHVIADLDINERVAYAGFVSTVLLSGGGISDSKSRLFKLLLVAMDVEEQRDQIFEKAHYLDEVHLREFLCLLREKGLASCFFMDVLVVCRLDGLLTETQQSLLAEFMDLVGLTESELGIIQNLVATVLGLPSEPLTEADFDYSKIQCWHEFLYRPLTNELIAAGISCGFWLVRNAIKINTAWTIRNAYLRFTEEGSIFSETNGDIIIEGCHLQSPKMVFKLCHSISIANSEMQLPEMVFEACYTLKISNSSIIGNFDPALKRTAIVLRKITGAEFRNLSIQTKNARAFYLHNSEASFTLCDFVGCGHPEMIGGAIASNDREGFDKNRTIKVFASKFHDCIAKLGGGIRISKLAQRSIENCVFLNCISMVYPPNDDDWNGYLFGGGGVFSDETYSYFCPVVGCTFIGSTLNLGKLSQSMCAVNNSQFTEANISYRGYTDINVSNDCIFSNQFEERNVPMSITYETQSWWSQYE